MKPACCGFGSSILVLLITWLCIALKHSQLCVQRKIASKCFSLKPSFSVAQLLLPGYGTDADCSKISTANRLVASMLLRLRKALTDNMLCRKRIRVRLLLQLLLGTFLAVLYVQFQLLSSTEKYDLIKILRRAPQSDTPQHIDWSSYCGLSPKLDVIKQTGEEGGYFSTWQNTGALNEFGWKEIHGADLNSLVKHTLFPNLPSNVGFMRNLSSWLPTQRESYGRWMFGFLLPDVTGEYAFAIASDDSSELWLSTNDDHNNVQMVASVGDRNNPGWTGSQQHVKYPKQISERVPLHKCHKYFIEIFHKQAEGTGFVEVSWIRPGIYEFEIIKIFYVSPLIATKTLSMEDVLLRRHPQLVELMDRHAEAREEAVKAAGRKDASILPFLRDGVAKEILPQCPQTPPMPHSSQPHATFKDYSNASALSVTQVYPLFENKYQEQSNFNHQRERLMTWQRRDYALSEAVARGTVNKFISALHAHYPGGHALQGVYSVERYRDTSRGERFFLDISLQSKQSGRAFRMAEYAYKRQGSVNQLCFPDGLQWRRNASVHVIVTASKNQTTWVQHLVESIGAIQTRTEDRNIRVIVLDYGGNGLQTEKMLQANPVKCTVIRKSGSPPHQADVINEVSQVVKDRQSILLLMDLLVQLPGDVFDQVRKHCIEGRLAFSPVAFRLERGFHPEDAVGLWDYDGYSTFAAYKSDWDKLGRPDSTLWDLPRRAAMAGLEVVRTKLNDFYIFCYASQKCL